MNFVRQHGAQPGVTVTESKFLHDASLGIDREVDIVVEGTFDGDPVVTSIEVTEVGRPATVEWAERLIGKHRSLPTNRLMLVSKSGFTSSALAAVAREGGWVAAVTPQPVEVGGQPFVKSLFMDLIRLDCDAFRLYALIGNDQWVATVPPDSAICDVNGVELGTADDLARETFHLPWLRKQVATDAHHHPERDLLDKFECVVVLDSLGYYLRAETTNELHHVKALEFKGKFRFVQQELAFEFSYLGSRRYGFTEAPIMDQPVVWVASTDENDQTTKISGRTKDGKPLSLTGLPIVPVAEPLFPGLLELQPPLTAENATAQTIDTAAPAAPNS
jgi:hypothetical protein